MKKVRKLFDELFAFLPMIIIIGLILYVSKSVRENDSFKPPMERGITIDDQKITVAQLFEASAEDISYASHLKATGSFYKTEKTSSDLSKSGVKGASGTFTLSDENASFDIKYDRYYTDSENYKWTLSGEGEFQRIKPTLTSFYGYSGDTDDRANYTYYGGMANGEEIGSPEDYDRDGPVAIIDLEKILVPDLTKLNKTSMEINGDLDYIKISFFGTSCCDLISDAFVDGNVYGIYCISEIDYYFTRDAYHKLKKVEMKGSDNTTNMMNWIIDRTYSGTVTVDEVSFGN
ncbi:hypothetical protein [Butyrivibrio proteoclasticus]|uniref:hypothetical protein n=1 Tax=Butyrivibrio proteoclasticus TaxID=43305 RepID=UPI000551118A|nr:hypothetical protein [Butyrivibrio proteoclasticus]